MDEIFVREINKELLTPVIYKLIKKDNIILVGFFDMDVSLKCVYGVMEQIKIKTGKNVHIYDIRELPEWERFEALSTGKLIYADTPFVQQLFTAAMKEDMEHSIREKKLLFSREKRSGSIYLS